MDLSVGEHPVQYAPVALQCLYASDPGTLPSKWLADDMAGATQEELLQGMTVMIVKYAECGAHAESLPETRRQPLSRRS